MSKKAKAEVADESAVIITDAVLAENQAKLDKLNSSIQAAYERRRKVITDSKLYTYDKLSQLYGGAEGQKLLDAVTAEHTLIGKLTDSGMPTLTLRGWSIARTVQTASRITARTMMLLTDRLPSLKTKIRMRFNITDNKTIAVNGTALPFLTAVYEGREIKRNTQT